MNLLHDLLGSPQSSARLQDLQGEEASPEMIRAQIAGICDLPQLQGQVGRPVLVEMDLTMQALVGLLAVIAAGAIAVPVPSTANAGRLHELADLTGADVALVRSQGSSPMHKILTSLANGPTVQTMSQEPHPFPETWKPAEVSGSDLAMILFTSGTTGAPKGVQLTHDNFRANISAILSLVPLGPEDVVPLALPLHYSYGLSMAMITLAAGARGVFLPPLHFADEFAASLVSIGPTVFAGVPAHYQTLLNQKTFTAQALPNLRMLLQAGGPMTVPLVDKVTEVFPGARVYLMYGQSEATARLTILDPQKLRLKPASAGSPLPGVSISIRDPQGAALAHRQVGEIYATGPNVMTGYWNAPAATAATLTEHGLRTGDLGYLDAEGDLFITGRRAEFAKVRGERLSAVAIEELIIGVPGVQDCTVQVGRAPSAIDDSLRAHVLLDDAQPDGARNAIRRAVMSSYGPAAVPEVLVVADLPRTESGKKIRHFTP